MASTPSIRITQVEGYRFTLDFGELFPALLVDEAEPIGGGEGPCPEQLLIAGVTNCLCASLVFAMGKFKQDPRGLGAEARCRIERNPEDRLRITQIEVEIKVGAAANELPRIDRVLSQFERFCTVSESVKTGIPVSVVVRDGLGALLM